MVKKNRADQDAPFFVESYDASAIIILAMQQAKSDKITPEDIRSVTNEPGVKIYRGELAKALKLIKKGTAVNYEGSYGLNFDKNGDVQGFFKEEIIVKGKFKTVSSGKGFFKEEIIVKGKFKTAPSGKK
ncbi:MAG TPA: hypothetical protein QF353_02925 [Gammaproteobacteria bacterium]|nr:hypothetical protein [Gammaproteobacteria bacterium]